MTPPEPIPGALPPILAPAGDPGRATQLRGILLLLLAIFLFTLMDATGKHLSTLYHPVQVVWARFVTNLAIVAVIFAPRLRGALAAWPDTEFVQVYGMTELAGVITALLPDVHRDPAQERRMASAGTPIPGVEMRVVDPATLEDVAPGGIGELWWRSAQTTPGYWNRPDATAETITPDGWLRSGDMGRADDGGFVFIEDRLKDMIITGGENVYCPEVERVLVEHPAVAEVAVIGVPDEKWGETVKAVVVLAPDQKADEQELVDYTRRHLAHFKCPSSIDIVDMLPRNPTGKILKRSLRAPYWAGHDRTL